MDYQKLSPELMYLSNCLDQEDHIGINDIKGILSINSNYKPVYPMSGMIDLVNLKRIWHLIFNQLMEKPARTSLFIHCNEGESIPTSELKSHDVQVNHLVGNIWTADLPISKINYLSELKEVKSLEASTSMNKSMDKASTAIHLTELRNQANVSGQSELTGKGVIIGIIDTGIDAKHEAFAGRILRIWDQKYDSNEGGPTDFRKGKEHIGNKIYKQNLDWDGHGTHVAGISGGNHLDYGGVAPGADFVIVRTTFDGTDIANAIQYIFRVSEDIARERGETLIPTVINLSLGDHKLAHDGSDAISKTINLFSGPGKIVCVAAGNEGKDAIHAKVAISDVKQVVTFKITREQSDNRSEGGFIDRSSNTIFLKAWCSGNQPLKLTLNSPDGSMRVWDELEGNNVNNPFENAKVTIDGTSAEDNNNGSKSYLFTIRPKRTSLDQAAIAGFWELHVVGKEDLNSKLDIWLADSSSAVDGGFIQGKAAEPNTIPAPGWAKRAITVGSYATRLKWKNESEDCVKASDIDRNIGAQTTSKKGQPSWFTSVGNSNNRHLKPDVCAPGEFICAPKTARLDDNEVFTVNNRSGYHMMRGTSMATPVVTGAIALMLEENKNLTPEIIRKKLKKTSSYTGKISACDHDPVSGYGFIDIKKLLES